MRNVGDIFLHKWVKQTLQVVWISQKRSATVTLAGNSVLAAALGDKMKAWGNLNLTKFQRLVSFVRDGSVPGFAVSLSKRIHPLQWLEKGGRKALRTTFRSLMCRALRGLALAGHLLLRPAHAAHGPHVLHAGDAALPALQQKEARGGGGAAVPAGAGRSHRVGVRPHWRRVRRTGERTGGLKRRGLSLLILVWDAEMFRRLPAGIQLPLSRSEGPWRLQAAGDRRHADGVSANDRHQCHHVLRWDHFWAGTFWGEEPLHLCSEVDPVWAASGWVSGLEDGVFVRG